MARKESFTERKVEVKDVEGYHHGQYEKKRLFGSDRPMDANEDYTLAKDGSVLPMIGIEWETQNWGITSQKIYANVLHHVVFANFHYDLWKIERDGSLDQHGCTSSAECISQPMSKAFIRNNYRNFKAMWKWAKELGISCTKTGDCGMHVHIANTCFGREKKTIYEAIRKFVYIINKHYDMMVYVFHRNPNAIGYCPVEWEFTNMETVKGLDFERDRFYDDHHTCVNLGHIIAHNNVELRLVGGQKDYGCFRNTMECVFHIVDTVKHISWKDCDDIVKIFSGCNQYVYDRLCTLVYQANKITLSQLEKIRETVKTENLL